MIGFDDINTFKPNKTELCAFVEQRYLVDEVPDLRSDRNFLVLVFDSNLTPTTLPTPLDLEISKLHENQSRLIKQRNLIIDSSTFNDENKELKMIDNQLDYIEASIASLENNFWQHEILDIDLFIQDNEKRIQRYISDLNSI
jgi:hypothetical protein